MVRHHEDGPAGHRLAADGDPDPQQPAGEAMKHHRQPMAQAPAEAQRQRLRGNQHKAGRHEDDEQAGNAQPADHALRSSSSGTA